MRRYLVILLCLALCSGCYKSSNEISIIYKGSNKQEEILLGLENSTSQVSNFVFDGTIANSDKTYDVEGKMIFKESIANSVIKLDINEIELYLKDKTVYIGYVYNDTKVIIKDELDVFIDELALILKKDKAIVKDYIYNKGIDDLKLNNLEYIGKQKGKYIVGNKIYRLELNNSYLPVKIKYNDDVSTEFNLDYSDVSISIPLGYDIFPLSIGQVKKLLKINSLADIL